MKKLIKLNIILWIIILIIPVVAKNETTELLNIFTDSVNFSINTIVETTYRGDYQREMHISENGIQMLKDKEGLDYKAIKYSGEKYYTIRTSGTIGADVKCNQTISKEGADKLLRDDMAEYESYVKKWCDYMDLNQNEFDALVIFVYNCGEGNLKKLTGNKTRPKEDLKEHWLFYTKSQSESNRKGLLNRRQAELNLFLQK